MASCIRAGNRYKRHQYENGVCKACEKVKDKKPNE